MASYEQIARRLARLEGKSGSTKPGHGPAQVIIVRYTQDWREVEHVNPTLEAKIAAEVKALTHVMTTEAALVGYDKPYTLTIYACDDGTITPEAPPGRRSFLRMRAALSGWNWRCARRTCAPHHTTHQAASA